MNKATCTVTLEALSDLLGLRSSQITSVSASDDDRCFCITIEGPDVPPDTEKVVLMYERVMGINETSVIKNPTFRAVK